jgi:hypothetical protein
MGRLNDRRCTLFMGIFVICMGKCYYNGTATLYTTTFFYTVGKSLYSGVLGIVGIFFGYRGSFGGGQFVS